MAHDRVAKQGQPRDQEGQGAVEAVVALPFFLLLVCLTFQLFLLGLAQVQLQYAAFCAARVGAVHNSDREEMEQAVKRILAPVTGIRSLTEKSFRVEILETINGEENQIGNQVKEKGILRVCIHWQYPLTVPMADTILKTRGPFSDQRSPSIHLKASWSTPSFGSPSGENANADNQHI